MRGPASASRLMVLVVASLALGACSAVDDFSKFKFQDDAGAAVTGDMAGGGDLASVDMTPVGTVPGFGQPCTTVCAVGLTCAKEFGGKAPAPGGICTRSCAVMTCSDLPNATCVSLNNIEVCMPRCNPSQNQSCRPSYLCCDGNSQTTGMGACSPPNTDFCGM
jgi:hypothetical protein